MFIDGVRTSTWAAVAGFIVFALVRRDRRVIFAGWVWISGFEAAFGLTSWLMHDHTVAHATKLALLTAVGVVTVPFFAVVYRIRPAAWAMLVVAAIWIAWVIVGFPVNAHDATTINPLAEVLNEAAKTMLAVAYLWPFRRRPAVVPSLEEDARGELVRAAVADEVLSLVKVDVVARGDLFGVLERVAGGEELAEPPGLDAVGFAVAEPLLLAEHQVVGGSDSVGIDAAAGVAAVADAAQPPIAQRTRTSAPATSLGSTIPKRLRT